MVGASTLKRDGGTVAIRSANVGIGPPAVEDELEPLGRDHVVGHDGLPVDTQHLEDQCGQYAGPVLARRAVEDERVVLGLAPSGTALARRRRPRPGTRDSVRPGRRRRAGGRPPTRPPPAGVRCRAHYHGQVVEGDPPVWRVPGRCGRARRRAQVERCADRAPAGGPRRRTSARGGGHCGRDGPTATAPVAGSEVTPQVPESSHRSRAMRRSAVPPHHLGRPHTVGSLAWPAWSPAHAGDNRIGPVRRLS